MIKYCLKCHKEAYRLEENGDSTKIIQNGRVLLNVSKTSKVSMNVSCPNGHSVKLEIDNG